MNKRVSYTGPLPRNIDGCIREIGQLCREMASEYDSWGTSEHWQAMFDRKENVKAALAKMRMAAHV